MLYDEYYYFLSKQNDKKLFEKILFLARIIIEYRIESLNLEKITYKTIFETIEETTIEEVLSDSSKYYPELRDFDFNCYNLNWETFIKYLEKKLHEIFKDKDYIKDIRNIGLIGAIELKDIKPNERIGRKIYAEALKKGVFVRPIGNTVYFMPPYVITENEIDIMLDVCEKSIEEVLK